MVTVSNSSSVLAVLGLSLRADRLPRSAAQFAHDHQIRGQHEGTESHVQPGSVEVGSTSMAAPVTPRRGTSHLAHLTNVSISVAVHHWDAGLYRRLRADVAMTDGVVVGVLGGEATRAMAVDRPDVLAIEADVPDPLGWLREGDSCVEVWLHHGEFDSVVLDHRTRATEGRECKCDKPTPAGSGKARHGRRYTAKTQTTG
jgi:hypothetical protein